MKDDLDLVRVIDPKVDINNLRNKQYGIYSGGSQNSYKQFISNTYDDSQISWVATPPSQNTYVSRRLLLNMKFRMTFTGQSAGVGIHLLQAAGLPTAPGVQAGTFQYDAPRCSPLASAFRTLQVQMNNDNISTNLSSYSRILQRFNRNSDEEDKEYSMSPMMPDQSQSYNDLLGFPRNPLAAYGDNVDQCPRGGFTGCTIIRNDSTGLPGDIAIVDMEFTEPFWLSPWSFGRNQEEVSFISIQNINVQATLNGRGNGVLTGLGSALWSHAPQGSALVTATANVLGGSLFFNYISPDLTQQLPSEVMYSYFEPTLYPTSSSIAVAPNQATTLVMNNVQLNTTPNRMYIFVSQRDQDVNITSTDTYFRIDKINITYNNQDGILSNMVIQDLYNMYLRNGGNMSYPQFTKYVGSVVCVSFGPDIPLDALNAPGVRDSQNLSLTVQCTNVSNIAMTPTLNVLVVQEGVMYINGNSIMRSVGVLDHQDVLNSKSQSTVSYQASRNFYGSGFWDDVGSFFRKLVRPGINLAKSVAPPQFQPLVSGADEVARSYGLGLGKKKYLR